MAEKMINKLYLDFECRSLVDLKLVGAYRYASDPSTEIISVAWALNSEPVHQAGKEDIQNTLDCIVRQCLGLKEYPVFVAHNAFFERCMWKFKVKKSICINLHMPQHWMCTMAKCYAHNLPAQLEKAAKALRLPVEKDMVGNRIMMKLSKPRKSSKKNPAIWHESPEDYQKMYEYNKQDVVVERMVDQAISDLSPDEQKVWIMDQQINDRGILVDVPLAEKAIAMMDEQKVWACGQMTKLTEGVVTAPTQIQKIKKHIKDVYNHEFDCLDKQAITEILEQDLVQPEVKAILKLRAENGKSSTAKYKAMVAAEVGGRVYGMFNYHAASTGRWGGRLVQMHNLPRGTVKDIETARHLLNYCNSLVNFKAFYGEGFLACMSSLIRSMFISPKDKDFIVGDYASIEARVLHWEAGDFITVDKFVKGIDLYVEMAQLIYDNPALTGDDTDERFVGKQTILGCGYQMGSNRFREQCKTYGVVVSPELAAMAVNSYRKRFKKVVRLWYSTDRAVRNAIINKGRVQHVGKVTMKYSDNFLKIRLPSGRLLYYYKAHIDRVDNSIRYWGINSKTKQFERLYTYGGMLVENITQAIARDILTHGMANLPKKKYQVILHVHDEIAAEVHGNCGTVEEFCRLICELPAWAKGCPIKAEGWRGKHYKK